MDLRTVDSYLNYKLDENSDFILLTFYNVYFTGQEYEYNEEHKIVKDNELLVAIKI